MVSSCGVKEQHVGVKTTNGVTSRMFYCYLYKYIFSFDNLNRITYYKQNGKIKLNTLKPPGGFR